MRPAASRRVAFALWTAWAVVTWKTIAQGRAEKELGMIVDDWKSLGVQVEPKPLSPAIAREREAWTSFPGLDVRLASGQSFYADRLHSSQVMTSANRWAGSNAASYANPDVDELLDRLSVTLPRAERVGLTRDLVRLVMSDIGIMPLYWDAEVIVARAGGRRGHGSARVGRPIHRRVVRPRPYRVWVSCPSMRPSASGGRDPLPSVPWGAEG